MNKGNITTILAWVWVILAPYLTQYMTQDQFTTISIALIGIIINIINSYYPNTFQFLNNQTITETETETVLNDEYEH